MAIPREYHGAAIVGQQLFVLGGNGAGARQSFEAANLTQLPSVGAGGPYAVPTGASVQVSASGSDPESGALDYAWDIDGDLLYETPGQNPTIPTAGLAAGPRTIRVRALDPLGAYAVASATLTITGPTGLQFATQPGNAQVGQRFAPQPVVRAVDAGGNVVPGYTGPITVTFGTNAGAGILGGTATVNAVNGVATFTDLFVNTPGNGYTLVASSGGLTTATSAPFNVTTAAPTTPPVPPIPPSSGPCAPRPNVRVTTSVASPGVLSAAVASQISPALPVNSLNAIRLTRVTNATFLVNGTPVTEGASVPLPSAPPRPPSRSSARRPARSTSRSP